MYFLKHGAETAWCSYFPRDWISSAKNLLITQLPVNVSASFQLVVTDNLFHKLKGLDHSIFYYYWLRFVRESDVFLKHRTEAGEVI